MPTLDPCHIWIPSESVTMGFVYSCPGQAERDAGRPCAGRTGRNLEAGLAHLMGLEPDIFHSTDRYEYLITNAWPQVEFQGKTGRSEALVSEILAPDNIARLHGQIAQLQYVIACGGRATRAVRECVERLELRAQVAYVSHTGDRGLVSGKKGTTLITEIEQWAHEVGYQLAGA